jgi:putative NADH-flavin reductase
MRRRLGAGPGNNGPLTRVTIIVGTGHVGTWLLPELVALGHDVTCVSRSRHGREPRYRSIEAVQESVGWLRRVR